MILTGISFRLYLPYSVIKHYIRANEFRLIFIFVCCHMIFVVFKQLLTLLTLRSGPVVWTWNFHVGGIKYETPHWRKRGVCLLGQAHCTRLAQFMLPHATCYLSCSVGFTLLLSQRVATASFRCHKKILPPSQIN